TDSWTPNVARITHADSLPTRPPLLGPAQAHAGSTPRCLVGCQQNRTVSASHRDFPRVARVLSRGPAHTIRVSVPVGLGAFRSGESGEVLAARGFVDFWTRGGVRAPWRRR